MDAFAQNNGHLAVSDARYINGLKLFIQAVTPLEYSIHRGYAHLGRQLGGAGLRIACQLQSLDELRHSQTATHALGNFNRFFNGMHHSVSWFDRLWYLAAPKSFIEDAFTAGPFEFLTAISFCFDGLLTNLMFVPFMSGAANNGDLATTAVGFSTQSDNARHMAVGLAAITFILQQDAGNAPIVQKWMDKWFWRGFRLLTLAAMMQDYMLPKRTMSWREAWEIYGESNGAALFKDLAQYGIREPKGWRDACAAKDHLSHQAWNLYYTYASVAAVHSWVPSDEEMAWLSEKYPQSFDQYYRPRLEYYQFLNQTGRRFYNHHLPMMCQTCQHPVIFTATEAPATLSHRQTRLNGEMYHFCSDPCRDIFVNEPEKYLQARIPVHQMHQGHCFKPEPDGRAADFDAKFDATFDAEFDATFDAEQALLAWGHITHGQDNLDFDGSPDQINFKDWGGNVEVEGAQS